MWEIACMNRRQITLTYWQSNTNIVHLPMDPLHISAEALIFINDKSILSALVFCGNQMELWLKLTSHQFHREHLSMLKSVKIRSLRDRDVDVVLTGGFWPLGMFKLVCKHKRTEGFYSKVNTLTNKIYKLNFFEKKKMLEWECALHFLLHQKRWFTRLIDSN